MIRFLHFVSMLFICLIFSSFNNPKQFAVQYIQEYKDLANIEMRRTGIPASIKLAQGLLESNYGKSELALHANNHFGIKCKSYWRGQTFYHQDDDLDFAGNLIESCFRAYETPIDSYVDHSNFLSKTSHYRMLFKLEKENYEAWAKGLKLCGYATDPQYAEKLISKIEEFELFKLDNPSL